MSSPLLALRFTVWALALGRPLALRSFSSDGLAEASTISIFADAVSVLATTGAFIVPISLEKAAF